jgi:hypothetical protein
MKDLLTDNALSVFSPPCDNINRFVLTAAETSIEGKTGAPEECAEFI